MSKIEFIASTLFGVEAITAREVKELGYKDVTVENGKVTFVGDEMALCRSNLWIRTAERIYVKIGEFTATTFEELFEGTKALHWEDWIPEDGRFPVEGYSIKSKLFSVSDCQAIVKKAVVERLKKKYKKEWFEENGATYKIKFSLMKDKVTLMIDTSGDGLHKRGYRVISNEAPLRETLAAAMIMLSFWKPDRPLIDPFCGSGTIPIEAAMIGINLAPGLKRQFVSEKWWRISNKLWKEAREEAVGAIKKDITLNIKGYDIDENAIKLSKDNARKAGVEKYITFENISLKDLKTDDKYGVIICNPPYGERMGKLKEVEKLYKEMGKVFKKLDTWSFYILTSHEKFEKLFGREASKKRKLYNGMLKAYYYQYYGPKPEN
ncbi:putative N6-adenine-specific DNA methylase [Thermoanaerobacter thermohydrosulfuricus]|uniref:rRNA (Guanine-N(2)-)-methyltransferase n=4 Tax=Thermoanaerobacter TaxID=1754 RepID=E8UWU8_THEBF|nr:MULTISPECIES: class I SAM-dependent RNA methyltransferase [Thermoanaerobacter]ABY95540.1 putative RNA methylase [Thermoanaerobacter pseudethanolicus ATCC 33223]ADV80475.1 rRNA (guanine-N(2)-)-methyltransferase [Thermoanaerobacter brockii subsp. finnii Ako-1]EMT39528.1 putative N6-adenine-specific DNA methylase [Thermoanaerobacter thermohydrosulfuricus WC1]SDF75145.1 putative N6-adenine-specific DNA methylase [Thermoanaerobacter thermohydrosulfuricus]HBW60375.1 class I SAM-dependent RNA meth